MPSNRKHRADDTEYRPSNAKRNKPNDTVSDDVQSLVDLPTTYPFCADNSVFSVASTSSLSLETPSEIELPRTNHPRSSHNRHRDSSYIPRPPNAFILFRSSFIRSQRVTGKVEGNHSNLSKIIGMYWNSLPKAERDEWEAKAVIAQAEHRKRYPDWRFRHGTTTVDQIKFQDSKPQFRRKRAQSTEDPTEEITDVSHTWLGDSIADKKKVRRARRRGKMRANAVNKVKDVGKEGSTKAREEERFAKIAKLLGEGKKGEELEDAIQEWERGNGFSLRDEGEKLVSGSSQSGPPSSATSAAISFVHPPNHPATPNLKKGSSSTALSWPTTPIIHLTQPYHRPLSGQGPYYVTRISRSRSPLSGTYQPASRRSPSLETLNLRNVQHTTSETGLDPELSRFQVHTRHEVLNQSLNNLPGVLTQLHRRSHSAPVSNRRLSGVHLPSSPPSANPVENGKRSFSISPDLVQDRNAFPSPQRDCGLDPLLDDTNAYPLAAPGKLFRRNPYDRGNSKHGESKVEHTPSSTSEKNLHIGTARLDSEDINEKLEGGAEVLEYTEPLREGSFDMIALAGDNLGHPTATSYESTLTDLEGHQAIDRIRNLSSFDIDSSFAGHIHHSLPISAGNSSAELKTPAALHSDMLFVSQTPDLHSTATSVFPHGGPAPVSQQATPISTFSSLAGWDGKEHSQALTRPGTTFSLLGSNSSPKVIKGDEQMEKVQDGAWQADPWGLVQPLGLQGGSDDLLNVETFDKRRLFDGEKS